MTTATLKMTGRTGAGRQTDWTSEQLTVQEWLADARSQGEIDAYSGKRGSPRIGWQAPLTVDVIEGATKLTGAFAQARNISQGGMALRVREKIAADSLIRISDEETGRCVNAIVRHCTTTLGGYLIGVEFTFSESSSQPLARCA